MLLILQLLAAMVLLSIIGEPLRIIIRHYSSLFHELDILQIIVLDVYLGGIILYALALIPLGLFNAIVLWTVTLMSIGFVIAFYIAKLRAGAKSVEQQHTSVRVKVKNYLMTRKYKLLEYLAVLSIFLASLWIQVTPFTQFVLGSIHDTSLHALFVELILENGQIPATHQPYLSAAIIYPQAAHVIFAYASCIFGLIPPKAIFYFTPLFSAMTVLAAHYLGKELHPKKKLNVVFAFIIAFVSIWPQSMTWGSNPFIVSFPLFLVCLSFLPLLFDFFDRNKILEICLIGIIFGYTASLHLASYELLILSAVIWLSIEFLCKRKGVQQIGVLLVMCAFSLLAVAPFLYRFVKYYPYPGHNIGLPSDIVPDITTPPTTHSYSFQSPIVSVLMNFPAWLASCHNIHPDLVLRIVWICLAFASFLPIFISLHKRRKLSTTQKIVLVIVAAVFLLNLFTYIMPTILWSRICFLFYISICLLIATLSIRLLYLFRTFFAAVLHKIIRKDEKKIILSSCAAAFLLLSILYAPFVHYTLLKTPDQISYSYGLFAVTRESDYELMVWMKDNLASNVVVLINPYDSGLFIPSISQKKVVFPTSAYLLSSSYRRLINSIQQGMLNQTTYSIMNHFNITYVFLGSDVAYPLLTKESVRWDPLVFLGNPNFKFIKNISNSSLFMVNPDPDLGIVFEEDFEDLNSTQFGWKNGHLGRGNHSIEVISNKSGNHLLKLTALKNQSSRWLSACWSYRKIYLVDSHNVTITFDLDASGVSEPNTVELSVFDANRTRGLTFATETILHQTQSHIFEIQSSNPATHKFNLGEIWTEKFQEPLPEVIVIELAVVNVDDTYPTVAFFDNITLTIND